MQLRARSPVTACHPGGCGGALQPGGGAAHWSCCSSRRICQRDLWPAGGWLQELPSCLRACALAATWHRAHNAREGLGSAVRAAAEEVPAVVLALFRWRHCQCNWCPVFVCCASARQPAHLLAALCSMRVWCAKWAPGSCRGLLGLICFDCGDVCVESARFSYTCVYACKVLFVSHTRGCPVARPLGPSAVWLDCCRCPLSFVESAHQVGGTYPGPQRGAMTRLFRAETKPRHTLNRRAVAACGICGCTAYSGAGRLTSVRFCLGKQRAPRGRRRRESAAETTPLPLSIRVSKSFLVKLFKTLVKLSGAFGKCWCSGAL